MNIACNGAGYVGLVDSVVFAEAGNNVICTDINVQRIAALNRGEMVIKEQGLEALLKKNLAAGRLKFSASVEEAAVNADVLFTCVGTPELPDGSADVSGVFAVAEQIGRTIVAKNLDYRLIVNKSTVPPGTTDAVFEMLRKFVPENRFDVAMCPEFSQEGKAVENVRNPDRVVIGAHMRRARAILEEVYRPFVRRGQPVRFMTPREAEIVKYGANGLLATRLGFVNELADLCDALGANVRTVLEAVTDDERVGKKFAHPSGGYGGSCFPKDGEALVHIAGKNNVELSIMRAVNESNKRQRVVLHDKMLRYFSGSIEGVTLAVWGLAFKAGTDDVREAPSLAIIDKILNQGGFVQAYDPEAMESMKRTVLGSKITYAANAYDALKGADALVVCTEWPEFCSPDFKKIKAALNYPVVFDNKSLYDPVELSGQGIIYFGVGVENDIARAYRKFGK